MALRSRVRQGSFRERSTRKSSWARSASETDVVPLAAATVVLDQILSAAVIEDSLGPQSTIVRTRGMFSVGSDQSSATEFPFGAFGMALVSSEAAVAGAASIPSPYTDGDWDGWFVHGYFHSGTQVASVASISTTSLDHFAFDSKAMRKLQDNTSVVFLVENASATDGLVFLVDFRQLFKLH